jgi:hypothetical protein
MPLLPSLPLLPSVLLCPLDSFGDLGATLAAQAPLFVDGVQAAVNQTRETLLSFSQQSDVGNSSSPADAPPSRPAATPAQVAGAVQTLLDALAALGARQPPPSAAALQPPPLYTARSNAAAPASALRVGVAASAALLSLLL